MNRSFLGWAATTLIASSALWTGCVADPPGDVANNNTDAGGPGSQGNACFPNGTCNEGLECVSQICVNLDGAVGDASGDGATNRDGSSADGGLFSLACGSASFNSNTAVISAPDISAYTPPAGFTIEAWVNPTAYPLSGNATIVSHEIPAATMRSWSLSLDNSGELNFSVSTDGTTLVTSVGSVVPKYVWSHVVGEFAGDGHKCRSRSEMHPTAASRSAE
jgi:hypothetical protein